MSDTIYALVDKSNILLYPMAIEDINARDNPTETYYKCFFDDTPSYDPITETLVEDPHVIGECVYVIRRVTDKDLDAIMAELNTFIANELANNRVPTVTSLPNGVLDSIMNLTVKRVQLSLDEFAKTRGYDDIRSLCTYATSTNAKFKTEGERGIVLRDLTWDALYDYMGTVSAGGIPYPFTWNNISSVLPALTWE